MKALYWFRKDLRLTDNLALRQACDLATELLPVVLKDHQATETTEWGFTRKGPHRVAFEAQAINGLIHALEERGAHLYEVASKPQAPVQSEADQAVQAVQAAQTVQALIETAQRLGLDTVFCESLPGSEEQQAVAQIERAGLTVRQTMQSGLLNLRDLPFAVEQTPLVFTAFRKAVEAHGVLPQEPQSAPTSLPPPPAAALTGDPALTQLSASRSIGNPPADARSAFPYSTEQWQADEPSALAHVERYFASDLPQHYKGTRNGLIGSDYSTKFSPWLAVGSLSPRTIYAALVDHEKRFGANDDTYWIWFELLWREHYQLLMLRFGARLFHRFGLANPPYPSQQNLPEKKAQARLKHWITGTTGQPFIDAGMRELAATGYLSNRLRQNVASYLIHDLAVDWRAGAAWFEHALIDYAVSSNQGNWAYIAGVGSDPRGGRRFNPDKQARDYDPQGTYQLLWANA